VVDAIEGLQPDLVVVGNLHGVGWSVSIIEAIAARGMRVAAYMHDMHYLTGRCASSFDCTAYRSGCTESCPTATRYPALAPSLIAPEWMLRRRQFVELGIPLIANSAWTQRTAIDAFDGRASVDLLPLGLDERRFSAIDRRLARKLLGIEDRPTIGFGAVDPSAPEKGGPTLARVVAMLAKQGIGAVAFGSGSERFDGAHALGFIDDERVMPVVYSALDCYLTASEAETFGQTALESLACGVPVVALRRGGLPEIVEDGVSGRLLEHSDAEAIADAAAQVALDATMNAQLGAAGRLFVERSHTLDVQGRAWSAYISGQPAQAHTGSEPARC
jgi:glycosyltransferase involved in cell wall biosynthesis